MGDLVFPEPAVVTPQMAYSFVYQFLRFRGQANRLFSDAEVAAGLDTTIYATEAAATTGNPANTAIPNFRIIDDLSTGLKLAYWDFIAAGSGTWSVTTLPFDYPAAFADDGYLLDTTDDASHTDSGGLGDTWGAANIYQVLQDCEITGFAGHKNAIGGGNAWLWAIWLSSTVGGSTTPPNASFNLQIANGSMIPGAASTWATSIITPVVPVRKGQWIGVNTNQLVDATSATAASLASQEVNDLIRLVAYGVDFAAPAGIVVPTSFINNPIGSSFGIAIQAEK